MDKFWKHGQILKLAELAEIKQTNLSEILHRKRGVSKYRAILLEKTSKKVLGFSIPFYDWIFNKVSNHPCFFD